VGLIDRRNIAASETQDDDANGKAQGGGQSQTD